MLGAVLVEVGGKFSVGGFRACRGSRIHCRRRGGNTTKNEEVAIYFRFLGSSWKNYQFC